MLINRNYSQQSFLFMAVRGQSARGANLAELQWILLKMGSWQWRSIIGWRQHGSIHHRLITYAQCWHGLAPGRNVIALTLIDWDYLGIVPEDTWFALLEHSPTNFGSLPKHEAVSAQNLTGSLISLIAITLVGTRQLRPPRQSKPFRIGTESLSIACELSTWPTRWSIHWSDKGNQEMRHAFYVEICLFSPLAKTISALHV